MADGTKDGTEDGTATVRFRATVELGGKSATGIPVPDEAVERLGAGRRPAVVVRIGGHSYRSTVAAMGGRFMLPLSAEQRAAAGVGAGDEVDVELQLDTAPREVEVPADLAAALAPEDEARAFFDGLSYSRRRAYVLWVEGAKTAETRQRRVAGAVTKLQERRPQP